MWWTTCGRARRVGVLRWGFAFLLATLLFGANPPAARAQAGAGGVADEVRCLALTIYFEARGEPERGKRAVAHVVMNRVLDTGFPDGVCEVVRQGGEDRLHRCQFSWWCDGRSDEPRPGKSWRTSLAIARGVYWETSEDPTAGALWYHASYVKPAWRTRFTKGPRIGDHIFYRPATVDPAASPQLARRP